MNTAHQLAHESWDATKDDADPEYISPVMSPDFRQQLNDVAADHLQGKGRSGIAGLEAFEDEVVKRIRVQREAPAEKPEKAKTKAKAGK